MKTSLAASPLLPIGTAAVAVALILGTMTSVDTSDGGPALAGASSELPVPEAPVVEPAAPAAPAAKVTPKCKAGACTAAFADLGTARLLGTNVAVTELYNNGAAVTIAGKEVIVTTDEAAKAGKYRVVVSKVAGPVVTLRFTRA